MPSQTRHVIHAALGLLLAAGAVGAAGRERSLIDAVKDGDAAAVGSLLRHGYAKTADAQGATPLHWAVYRDDLAAVNLLLGAGASVNDKNDQGVTPLWLACVNGNGPIVERLLAAGADANTTMAEGDTALMTAARTGSVAAIKALVARGADVNHREKTRGQTALMWAAADGHADAVRALLEAGADPYARTTDEGFTAFLFAARAGQQGAARALLDAGGDANDALVNKKNTNGASALILAIASGHYDFAAFLLDEGADPGVPGWGWSALHEVEFSRRPPAGRHGIPFPVPTGTMDGLALAQKLIDYGADPNARMTKEPLSVYFGRWGHTHRGVTPFWLAAKLVDVPFMRLMVKNGADPLLANAEGSTPLMMAAGVDVYAPGYEPGTPEEVVEAVKLCLELGNKATDVNVNGDTALHGAAIRGNNAVVMVLVEAGARLDVKNKKITNRGATSEAREGREGGWTPWQQATFSYQNGRALSQPETAALLARLMQERGLPVQ